MRHKILCFVKLWLITCCCRKTTGKVIVVQPVYHFEIYGSVQPVLNHSGVFMIDRIIFIVLSFCSLGLFFMVFSCLQTDSAGRRTSCRRLHFMTCTGSCSPDRNLGNCAYPVFFCYYSYDCFLSMQDSESCTGNRSYHGRHVGKHSLAG